MTSKKQIQANRRNARKSTGPKTAKGKAVVRLNALKHGLRAENALLLPGEDGEELSKLARRVSADLNPTRCVPPSWVLMLLAKLNTVSV